MTARVLVLESDDHPRGACADPLVDAGYVVTALNESTDASRVIADNPPDLVILCSGPRSRDSRIALCHELREQRGYTDVPILLACETVDEDLIRKATDARVLTLAAPGGDDRKLVSAVQGVLEAARDH